MATVFDFAVLIFVFGFLSLILDRDIVSEADAGPVPGPAMTVTACVLVFSAVYRRQRKLSRRAGAVALATMIAVPVVGSIAYSLARSELAVIPAFLGRYILSPFVLAAALVGAGVVVAAGILERRD